MPTLSERLRQAAQYTGLDSMRELLIEAAGALEGAEPVAGAFLNAYGGVTLCQNGREHLGPDFAGRLYTAPQPPERKPLTEDQIYEIALGDPTGDYIRIVRAIEAHHGIKE